MLLPCVYLRADTCRQVPTCVRRYAISPSSRLTATSWSNCACEEACGASQGAWAVGQGSLGEGRGVKFVGKFKRLVGKAARIVQWFVSIRTKVLQPGGRVRVIFRHVAVYA